MVVARKRFIPQHEFPLIPSFSVTRIQLSPAVRSTLTRWLGRHFSTFVRMRTRSPNEKSQRKNGELR